MTARAVGCAAVSGILCSPRPHGSLIRAAGLLDNPMKATKANGSVFDLRNRYDSDQLLAFRTRVSLHLGVRWQLMAIDPT